MVRPAWNNNRGFSLIELLIAVAIIEISMLALLTSILLVQRTNLQNELRNTAIRLTNQTAEALLALPANDSNIQLGTTTPTIYIRDAASADQNGKGFPQPVQIVRGYPQTFAIQWAVSPIGPAGTSSKAVQVVITVSYTYPRGSTTTYANNAVIYPSGSI